MPRLRTALALLVALPWLAWAVVRVGGLDRGMPLVPILAFTPYAAATAVLPVLVAVALRRRGVAVAATVPLVVLVALVVPRASGGARGPAGADGPALRVLTLNTHIGRADMRAVLRLARREDVDVVALQELTPEGLAHFDAAGGRRLFPGRAVEARTHAAGSGLFARRALTDRAPDDATAAEQPDAVLRLPGAAPLRLKTVHPYPPISGDRQPRWRASLARLPRPGAHPHGPLRVILGDFNATLDHSALRAVLRGGYDDAADDLGEGLVPTWREHLRPPLTIDHVLLDERIGVRAYSVHDIPGSDHRAVVATLVLPQPQS